MNLFDYYTYYLASDGYRVLEIVFSDTTQNLSKNCFRQVEQGFFLQFFATFLAYSMINQNFAMPLLACSTLKNKPKIGQK